MRMYVQIQPPIPPQINQSYIPFGYWNFGLCCWQYSADGDLSGQAFDGAIEWINTMNFVTEPKYNNPVAFRYFLKAGLSAIVYPSISVNVKVPDISINGTFYNAVTGKGMAVPLIP